MYYRTFGVVIATALVAILSQDSPRPISPEVLCSYVSETNEVPCNNEYETGENAVWTDTCEKAAVDCTASYKEITLISLPPTIPPKTFKVKVPTGCKTEFTQACANFRSGKAGGGEGDVTDSATFNCDQYGKYGCKITFVKWTFPNPFKSGENVTTPIKYPKCDTDGGAPVAGSLRFCGEYDVVATCDDEIEPPSTDPPPLP